MGGGVSKKSPVTVTSSWTKEEQEENDRGIALQHIASDFITEHIYYKIPIKCGKKSIDPASPIYIQIDPEVIEDGMDETLQKSVPSGITVTGKGVITCDFVFSNISYTFNVSDITASISQFTNDGDLIIPTPSPPWSTNETADSIQLRWILPQPAGIAREIDLQYTTDLSVLNNDEEHAPPASAPNSPSKNVLIRGNAWRPLANKTWDSVTFQFHVMQDLQPGSRYITRIRYRSYKGWSSFSKPSAVLKTLPGPPGRPDPPKVDVVLSDSIQLKWKYGMDNGSPIEEYVIRGRSGGETEFTDLSCVSHSLSFLVMHLLPENVYSFQIAARNALGLSDYSEMTTVMTPRMVKFKTEVDARHLAGYNCRDAWRVLYDPKTQQNFYFNQLTGTRQLAMPDILKEDPIELDTKNKAKEINPEIEFRKKRFRLLKGIHQQKQNVLNAKEKSKAKDKNSRAITPPPGVRIRGVPPTSTPPPTTVTPPSNTYVTTSNPTPDPELNSNEPLTVENSNLFEVEEEDFNYRKDIFSLELHRNKMLYDCYVKFKSASLTEIYKRLKTTFVGERGIDSGGISKELFLLISKEIMLYCGKKGKNWMVTLSDGTSHFKNPNDDSNLNEFETESKGNMQEEVSYDDQMDMKTNVGEPSDYRESLSYIALENAKITPTMFAKYMGRFIGKAIFDRQLINIPLSKQLRLLMLGKDSESEADRKDSAVTTRQTPNSKEAVLNNLDKLKELDSETYNSLKWMLNNSIDNILFETFTVTINGVITPLCKNGDQIDVTDENKHEYINLIVNWKTKISLAALVEPFLEGFHELVPLKILKSSGITVDELDLILNGKPTIDIDEIRGYCMFQGARVYGLEDEEEVKFGEDSEIIQWLWHILRSFEPIQCRKYLLFVTGTSRVPLDGYDPPFNITDGMDMSPDSLPKAHTCFNQIVLPRYTSYEIMKTKLSYAIENTQGFELS